MQLFITDADYYAKLRILLFNLQKGVDEDAAYLNAFGKSRAEMEKEVDQTWPAEIFRPPPWTARQSARSAIIRRSRCSARKSGWRWPTSWLATNRARRTPT